MVTGKLDVREAAARLPEETAEPEVEDLSATEDVASKVAVFGEEDVDVGA